MEEQDSLVLQKRMIVVLSVIILFLMSSLTMIEKQRMAKLATNSKEMEAVKENIEIANEEYDDVISTEQVYYSAVTEIVETVENTKIETEKKLNKESETKENKTELKTEETAGNVTYRNLAENNPPTEYKEIIQTTATAYCLCKKCCGKLPTHPEYGYTASGLVIKPGSGMKIIAVDPSVIELGSNVYVEGLNGAWDYGTAIAADTGSAIKDLKIDLYMDTHIEALSWGVKNVNVYVVD